MVFQRVILLLFALHKNSLSFTSYKYYTIRNHHSELASFLKEEEGLKKDLTVGQLLWRIRRISPDIGKRLNRIVDVKLRNTIAYGTFLFERGGKVFLSKNSYLDTMNEIPLHEFWISIKKQNIVALPFIDVLGKKINESYFKG